MFCFDVETLDTESTAVVLSAAILHFNPEDKPSYEKLLEDTLFVKFNVSEQLKEYNRTTSKDTFNWWNKQSKTAKEKSLIPRSDDLKVDEGLNLVYNYMSKFPNYKKCTMWARGSLDQMVIDSLAKKAGKPTISEYYLWRDVRTAVDILSGSNNGYAKVNQQNFNPDDVIKHDPRHDVAYDVMMLLYGTN